MERDIENALVKDITKLLWNLAPALRFSEISTTSMSAGMISTLTNPLKTGNERQLYDS